MRPALSLALLALAVAAPGLAACAPPADDALDVLAETGYCRLQGRLVHTTPLPFSGYDYAVVLACRDRTDPSYREFDVVMSTAFMNSAARVIGPDADGDAPDDSYGATLELDYCDVPENPGAVAADVNARVRAAFGDDAPGRVAFRYSGAACTPPRAD